MSHDHQVDAVHYAAAVIGPECPHPELNMTWGYHLPMERTYWCSQCKKKIAIPDFTLLDNAQERLAGIIGLVFGEPWAALAKEGKI